MLKPATQEWCTYPYLDRSNGTGGAVPSLVSAGISDEESRWFKTNIVCYICFVDCRTGSCSPYAQWPNQHMS